MARFGGCPPSRPDEHLDSDGWSCAPSRTHYLYSRPPQALDTRALRTAAIKLRDATSFGLPGWWRLSTRLPDALTALDAFLSEHPVNLEISR